MSKPQQSRTITARGTRTEASILAFLFPERGYWRPKTRADCAEVQRPCPYVACRYNLYLEAPRGSESITLNFPGKEPGDLAHSCALDVADNDTHDGYQIGYHCTLSEIAAIFGISRERVRQIEEVAKDKISAAIPAFKARESHRWIKTRSFGRCSGF